MNSGYYPAGAYSDSRAPYNQPDDSDLYEMAYRSAVNDVKNNDGWWAEFLAEKFNLETDEEIDQKVIECSSDEAVIDEYYEKYKDEYFDSVCNYDDEPDYDMRDEMIERSMAC